MTRPLLSVVIPTRGRNTLPRALASIRRQASATCVEIIICADTHGGPLLCDVRSLAAEFDAVYLEHDAGGNFTGHPQIDHGFRRAVGAHLLAIGDDDVYIDGALALVAEAVEAHGKPAPFMFKAEMRPSRSRPIFEPIILWDHRGLERGAVSSQNFVAPNVKGKVGTYWDDFAHIYKTVEAWGAEAVVWRPEVIAVCH